MLRDSRGGLSVDKTLTTHHDLLEGFFRGVDSVMGKAGIAAEPMHGVLGQGPTVNTNRKRSGA